MHEAPTLNGNAEAMHEGHAPSAVELLKREVVAHRAAYDQQCAQHADARKRITDATARRTKARADVKKARADLTKANTTKDRVLEETKHVIAQATEEAAAALKAKSAALVPLRNAEVALAALESTSLLRGRS